MRYSGQCTSVVDHEMVNADGPVTMDTVGMGPGLAFSTGTLSAAIPPDYILLSSVCSGARGIA